MTSINKTNKKAIASLCKGQKVWLVYIFGSQAKNQTGPLSDIDVAVYFDPSLSSPQRFQKRLYLITELGDIFKTKNIDVISLNDAPPLLEYQIVKEGKMIYFLSPAKGLIYEAQAMSRYLDWQPFLEKYTKETLGNL